MLIYDFEVFKYDWMISWLDTETRKMNTIHNDRDAFIKFYDENKYRIWIGYNSRGYDQWIAKGILAGFDPYKISDWIINRDRKGWEFSKLLHKFPILNYDTMVGFRSLKELESFMGDDIKESNVRFDIDRPLTHSEIEETKGYNIHDVWETFKVFIETKDEFESHYNMIKEFELPLTYINKTKAQLSAIILGASKKDRDDEFEISFPETLNLGKYEYVKDHYINWATNIKDYELVELQTEIGGVMHTLAIGGLHSAIPNYIGDGEYILADVSSYYPALMIEYDLLSRNVFDKSKFKQIRDERLEMKANRDPKEYPRKIVLNSTYGAMKDKYNNLYDPLQANNVCIYGQLLLVDLIDKLEDLVDIIQSNTDGVLFKLRNPEDRENAIEICEEWSKRTRMNLEYENYKRIIQKDVNNYIMVMDNGKIKCKGSYVKSLSPLDNDLPIVNKAIVDYFTKNIPPVDTILNSKKMIDFQKITKVSHKYEYAVYNGETMNERVFRTFATIGDGGTLYKQHKEKEIGSIDKTAGTPENCVIVNEDITEMETPYWLDRQWYIDLAEKRIKDFLGE